VTVIPVCFKCKHFRQDQSGSGDAMVCDAFPDPPGIPEAILLAKNDHSGPVDGDHGIRFEPIEAAGDKPDA
jgi:hypothetical protein